MSVALSTRSFSNAQFDTAIDTYLGSTQFLKTVVPSAIATALNRRCAFTPDYFCHNSIQDVPYFGFRSTMPSSHCAYQLYATTQKVLDELIVQKHLKDIFIIIENVVTEKALEEFVFSFKYNSGVGDDSFPLRGRSAREQVVKFFRYINQIPDDAKYPEKSIKIQFGCRFYNTIPKDLLQNKFKPANIPSLSCVRYMGTLKTNFHRLELHYSISTSLTPIVTHMTSMDIGEVQSIQPAHQRTPDTLKARSVRSPRSPASREVADVFTKYPPRSAYSQKSQDIILSQEFGSPPQNSSQEYPPIRLRTPKPRSKFVRGVLKRQMERESKEDTKPDKRLSSASYVSPMSFRSFSSRYSKSDMSDD